MAVFGKLMKKKAVRAGIPMLGAWAVRKALTRGMERFNNKKSKKKKKGVVGKALVWGVSTGAAAGIIRYWVRKKAYGN